MGTLLQDIRYSLRMLWKNRGVFGIAVIALALGIGLNTTIFSAVNAVFLRPLPVPKSSQIVTILSEQKNGSMGGFSAADFKDIEKETKDSFSGLFGYLSGTDAIRVDGKTDRIGTFYVTGNFFSTLGIKPALGRFILPGEGDVAGADPIIVLSYDYWKRLGSNPEIIGKKVAVNRHSVTVVGVAPFGFYGPNIFSSGQGYLPLGMAVNGSYPKDFMTDRKNESLSVLARLQPSVGLTRANASLAVLSKRLSQAYPDAHKDLMGIKAYPELQVRLGDSDSAHIVHTVSGLFLGLTAVLLLLACANVANILLVRATLREREMAIRAALGAARARLIRQLLTESVVLSLFGGVLGIFLGEWACSWLSSTPIEVGVPLQLDFGFDWRVFAYAFSAALFTGIIVGLIPAFRGSRRDLNAILHEGGRGVVGGKSFFRNTLVVAQIAGSLALLIVAGLFTRSLAKARGTNLGFNPDRVLNLSMDTSQIGYSDAQSIEFYKNLLDRVRALPGVQSASFADAVPPSVFSFETLTIDGQKSSNAYASNNIVSSDYFKTMEIPILRGREFTAADDSGGEYTSVINESMARKFWHNSDPLGKQFKIASDPNHLFRVVGVAKDSRFNFQSLTSKIGPYFCLPMSQKGHADSDFESLPKTLQLRTTILPEAMIPTVENLIHNMAPDLPLTSVQTMSQSLNTLAGFLLYEIGAILAAILGILGLILAVVGVYGVISYTSSQRTHEIGIRLALGAQPIEILKMIFRQGLVVIGIGLAIGILTALAATRVVESFLIISATDPLTYISVSAILTIVALVACYIPARRAMRVDPMVALRHE